MASLVALAELPPEEIVWVAGEPHVLAGERDWATIAGSFDGGVRPHRQAKVGGAGAWIWEKGAHGWQPLAKVVVALPGETSAPRAEAHGCRALLLTLLRLGDRARRACLAGDNLAVVRHAATRGRLMAPRVHGVLEFALQQSALAGWEVQWSAVRRRFNQQADEAATEGVQWARSLWDQGCREPQWTAQWFGQPPPQ